MEEKIKTIILIVVITVLACLCVYFWSAGNFDSKKVKENSGYSFKGNLSCTTLYSTFKKEVGENISLIDLDTDSPRALFEDSGVSYPMEKLRETEDLLVIQLVASGTGSIDALVLEKKTGVFARISAGSFAGIYATASKGNCK